MIYCVREMLRPYGYPFRHSAPNSNREIDSSIFVTPVFFEKQKLLAIGKFIVMWRN